jgi:hypothetical protein
MPPTQLIFFIFKYYKRCLKSASLVFYTATHISLPANTYLSTATALTFCSEAPLISLPAALISLPAALISLPAALISLLELVFTELKK